MIDNIKKFELFLLTRYPEIYKEVKNIIWYSPSRIYENTFNVFNPYTDDKKKAQEFENIIAEYGHNPLTRLIPKL